MKIKRLISLLLALTLICACCSAFAAGSSEKAVAVMRGGTVVLRIPVSVCDKKYTFDVPFSTTYGVIDNEQNAIRELRSVLTEYQYERACDEYINEGRVSITVNRPVVLNAEALSTRRIGNYWYICCRPLEKVGKNSIHIRWGVHKITYNFSSKGADIEMNGVYLNNKGTDIALRRVSSLKPILISKNGKLTASVYRCGGVNIAVLRDTVHSVNGLIGYFCNAEFGLPITYAHKSGKATLTCCVLKDEEVRYIRRSGGIAMEQ